MPKFISDAEMAKIISSAPKPKGSFISDAEMNQIISAPKEKLGLLDTAFEGAEDFAEKWTAPGRAAVGAAAGLISPVLKTADKYLGAPVRRAVYEAQDMYKGGLKPVVSGLLEQVGSDKPAPTGADIARRAGVPEVSISDAFPSMYSETGRGMALKRGGWADPSASGAVGLLNEIGTDPLSYVGASGYPKAKSLATSGTKRAIEEIPNVVSKLEKGTVSAASAASGVTKKEIQTLLDRTDEVLDLAKKYSNDMAAATDAKRSVWVKQIDSARRRLNDDLGKKLDAIGSGKTVDVSGVQNEIRKTAGQLHPQYDKQAIAEVDSILNEIDDAVASAKSRNFDVVPTKYGHSVSDLYSLKSRLQEIASGSYKKDGQIFQVGKKSQRAAKAGAAKANEMLSSVVPEVKEIDKKLAQLRKIEEKLNKNFLAEGKPNASVLSAGSDQNKFQKALAARLDEIAGTNIVRDAENLASAKTFGDPSLLPVDATGKSFTRLFTAMGGGLLLGGPKGLIAGGAMSSPAAIKAAAKARSAIKKGLIK